VRALAIDLGGTHATCGLVEDRRIVAHETLDTDRAKSLIAVLPKISDAFRRLVKGAGITMEDISGIAVGIACIVDSRSAQVLATHGKYDDARGVDLCRWSREEFGLPLRLENDARMALLGEYFAGAARGFSDVVMMTLGTGIGGATMIEGKLLRGKHFQAGCLGGHFPVLFAGRRCTCGGIGCAEAEASGSSLSAVVNDWPQMASSALAKYSDIGFKELFFEAAAGDHIARSIRDRCLQIWAADAVALIHAYDPEILVIGGGVMESADVIVPAVEFHVHQYAWTPWGKVQVRGAELGNNAALLGAVPLLSEALAEENGKVSQLYQ
jgi:glucokinase